MVRFRSLLPLLAAVSLVACGASSPSSRDDSAETDDTTTVEGSTSDTYPLDELGNPDVPKDVVAGWPALFCSLTIGMTRTEVRTIMGTPTQTFDTSSANQDEWDGYNVSVTAFYDMNDVVVQLDDSTGTSNLPCEQSRK